MNCHMNDTMLVDLPDQHSSADREAKAALRSKKEAWLDIAARKAELEARLLQIKIDKQEVSHCDILVILTHLWLPLLTSPCCSNQNQ